MMVSWFWVEVRRLAEPYPNKQGPDKESTPAAFCNMNLLNLGSRIDLRIFELTATH